MEEFEKFAFRLIFIVFYVVSFGTAVYFFIDGVKYASLLVLTIAAIYSVIYFCFRKKLSQSMLATFIFIAMFLSTFLLHIFLHSLNESVISMLGICVLTIMFFEPKISLYVSIFVSVCYLTVLIFFRDLFFMSEVSTELIVKGYVVLLFIQFGVYMIARFGKKLIYDNKNSADKAEQLVLEVQQKAEQSNSLLENQKIVSKDVKEISKNVQLNANGIYSVVDKLSVSSAKQAQAAEELSATTKDIKDSINNNLKLTQQLQDISQQTSVNVNEGSEQIKLMIEAMENIKIASDKVSAIVKNIDDIAFQTNILALNASVEAARAGAAGKGFSVVATEVRSLSEKSAEAAKNTEQLIKDTLAAVAAGTDTVNHTAESLQNIIVDTKNSETLINSIYEHSIVQNEAIDSMASAVNQIAEVVQENASTAEESAASSYEMLEQAKKLNEVVAVLN